MSQIPTQDQIDAIERDVTRRLSKVPDLPTDRDVLKDLWKRCTDAIDMTIACQHGVGQVSPLIRPDVLLPYLGEGERRVLEAAVSRIRETPGTPDRQSQKIIADAFGEAAVVYRCLDQRIRKALSDHSTEQDLTDEPITPAKLADRLGIPKADHKKRWALSKRLENWRNNNPNGGWIEDANARGRQPRYVYSLRTVWPIVKDMKHSG